MEMMLLLPGIEMNKQYVTVDEEKLESENESKYDSEDDNYIDSGDESDTI